MFWMVAPSLTNAVRRWFRPKYQHVLKRTNQPQSGLIRIAPGETRVALKCYPNRKAVEYEWTQPGLQIVFCIPFSQLSLIAKAMPDWIHIQPPSGCEGTRLLPPGFTRGYSSSTASRFGTLGLLYLTLPNFQHGISVFMLKTWQHTVYRHKVHARFFAKR